MFALTFDVCGPVWIYHNPRLNDEVIDGLDGEDQYKGNDSPNHELLGTLDDTPV